ncbi:MAG TPA: cytochrome c3 family protein [Calditrichia bacterium]|nr:cytochrome c3 family protein [Calditrichota bacterium]HQU70842.1 cytochrome c3 family protein [Calditrichia bacterium]HQV33801.1 cytochrome c3 family protein [Calditrichia bacterium]
MRAILATLLAGFFSVIALGMLGAGAFWVKYEKPEPQPIAYPHDLHAGKLNLECTHCHVYVDKSQYATVPAMKICMDCHKDAQIVSPEIDKLKKFWENEEPIPWQRIHSVPNHVYFSHERHVKFFAAKGETYKDGQICAKCHGNMKVVKEVKQTRTLKMGFCVSCHRAEGAPTDCWTCHKS